MPGEHPGARAARRDDVIAGRERLDRPARDRPGRGAIARIVGGLAAAGLRGNDDLAARLLQQLDRGEADARAHEVDEAGDEQPDAGPGAARLTGAPFGRLIVRRGFRSSGPSAALARSCRPRAHPKLAP